MRWIQEQRQGTVGYRLVGTVDEREEVVFVVIARSEKQAFSAWLHERTANSRTP